MKDNLITPDFTRRRLVQSPQVIAPSSGGVRGLFSGSAARYPLLLSPEILQDIDRRIKECERSCGGAALRTENSIRPKPARASHEDFYEAEIRFYGGAGNAAGNTAAALPFLILRAEHRRDLQDRTKVDAVYNLWNGLRMGSASANIRSGKNYQMDIAPYVSQRLFAALGQKAYTDPGQGYEAWTPS